MCYLNVITGSTARSGVLVTQVAFLSIFYHYDSVCSKGFFFFLMSLTKHLYINW